MGSQDKSPNSNNPMQRVKVYRLNEDGKWDDQGTGHVTVDYLERSEDLGLFVIDEEDNETLLLHRISSDDIYRKQEDTIISWRVPEFSTELALSFQETTGCSYLWDHICSLQRNMHFSSLANHKHDVQFCPADDGVESVSIVAEAEPCNHSAADLKKKEVAKGSKEGKCETGLNVTFLDLQSHFGHKRKDAAKKLGVSESTFKRLCRKYGIQRWPQNEKYKKNPSLFMTEIANQSGWDSQPNMNGLPNSTILPPPDMSQTEPKSSQHRITQPNVDVVVIYAKYESKTIKFKLCHTAGMEKLLSEVAMRLKMEVGSFEMEYLDEINEKILLTCDTDLELCLESVAAEGKCYIQISSLKNPTVMGKPCIQVVPPSSTPSSSAAAYIHHFPSCFHSYVLGVKNVVGDGHCGFRVVANLLGFGEESWGQVRRDLIDELRLNQQLYTSVFIENDAVEKILQILQCFDERASNAHWFTLPEMGYLVASTYNVALVSLSTNTNKCSTFLPLRTVVPCNLRCICIGLVYNVHFVQVFQCDGHPLPHVLAKWHECRYPEAAP